MPTVPIANGAEAFGPREQKDRKKPKKGERENAADSLLAFGLRHRSVDIRVKPGAGRFGVLSQ
jgi:hypothetical protein